MKKIAILLFLTGLQLTAFAQLQVARVFNSHAVLQRDKPVKIWGWAKPAEKVSIQLDKGIVSVKTSAEGKWEAVLPAMPAGGPHVIEVSTKKEKLRFEDILFGEVWLCSGQSNMEWRLKSADNAKKEIAEADYPNIRHFEVAHELEFEVQKDLKKGEWKICTPETAGDFTAVGYFFAREISKKLNVPVGLIHSSWGGSQVESWISRKAMEESEVLGYYPPKMSKNWKEDGAKWERKLIKQVYGADNYDITKVSEGEYLNPGYDYSKWLNVNLVGQWDWQGIWAFRGDAFIQKTLEVPAELAGEKATIDFGFNTGDLIFYLNGKEIFKGRGKDKISVEVPAGVLKAGANSLLVKTGENQDPTWRAMGFWGANDDFVLKIKNQKISLTDKQWKMRPSWQTKRHYEHWMNNDGTLLYNAMIAPLIPVGIQGVLWYQGESNASRAYQYRASFPLMINNWRTDWKDEFNFLFVQLSSYGPNQSSNEGSNWAELREAQTMTLSLPKTGMAVTTDIGNPNDIHPTNKQDVGHRLAINALKNVYGQDLLFSSPMYKKVDFDKGNAVVSFDHVGKGFQVKDKYGYVKGFEIAGEDRKFYYAKAEISGDKIIVSHPGVANPKSVRFGWANAPMDCNLFNSEGLPVSPFRTDTWDGITKGVKFE